MGGAKRQMEEDEANGYSYAGDHYVCPGCVADEFLAELVRRDIDDVECSFCEARQAAPIEVLLGALGSALHAYYNDPAGELPYDGREGGYQGEVHDSTMEAVSDLGWYPESEELREVVEDALHDHAWCDRDYFGTTRYESLSYGWLGFCEATKHKTRFLFFPQPRETDWFDDEAVRPEKMLDALGTLFRDYGLFSVVGANDVLLRARVVSVTERPTSASELGPVPFARATSPNRMSPAGIPMFYAAFNSSTAIAEAWDGKARTGRHVALGGFCPTRALNVLDLSSLPPVPSVFDLARSSDLQAIRFLHGFADDFSRPIERNESAHTEYVPTQIVTEYIRHRLRSPSGAPIDGIVYASSRCPGERAVVIFAEPAQCGPSAEPAYAEVLLTLNSVKFSPIPARRRKPTRKRK